MKASPALAVIRREFLTGLRSPKPFIFLAVILLIMIAGAAFLVGVVLNENVQWRGSISTQDVRAMFMLYSMGLYFTGMLLVPPLAAVSICVEKQQDSYDLLRMTYISPFSLVFAKLANVIGLFTLVAIATLPIVGVFFFLVGIDWSQILQSVLVIAVSVLSCAIIGLAASAFCYRTLPAIMTTYAVGFACQGGLLLLFLIAGELFGIDLWILELARNMDESEAAMFSPLMAIAAIGDGRLNFVPIVISLVFQLVIALIALKFALVTLNRPMRAIKVDQEKPIDDQAELQARRKSFPYYLVDPRRRRPMIPDSANPLFQKELQTSLLGKGTFAIRILYGFTIFCFIVSLFSLFANEFGIRNIEGFVAWPILIDTCFVLILAPSLIALSMSKEQEWGNLDMLRMTLLDTDQIMDGKFRTGVYTAILPMAGAVFGCLPLAIFAWQYPAAWVTAFTGFVSMAVCVFYTLAISLAVTATCRRGVTALLLGYGASIGALLLFPGLLLFLTVVVGETIFRGGRGPNDIDGLFDALVFLSPLTAQFLNVAGFEDYNADSPFNTYWLSNVLVFAFAAQMILKFAARRLDRRLTEGIE